MTKKEKKYNKDLITFETTVNIQVSGRFPASEGTLAR